MKKNPQETAPRKLNIGTPPAEQQEWTLEEIMNEFGGWTKREQEAAPQPEVPEEPPQPEAPAPEPQEEEIPVSLPEPKEKKPDLSGDTIRFTPVQAPEPEPEAPPSVWKYQGEQPPGTVVEDRQAKREERRKRQLLRQQKRSQRKEQRRRELPEHTFQTPEEGYRFYAARSSLKLRLLLSAVLTFASAVLVVLLSGVLPGMELSGQRGLFSALMLAGMLAGAVLAYDILIDGLAQILRLHFDGGSMLLILLLVSTADALFALGSGRIPFCTAVSLELTVALWGRSLLNTARRRTLKAVCSMEEPKAAVREEKSWHELDCIFRADADPALFTTQMELPDAGKRIMRVYAPIVTVLTLALALAASLRASENFLWAWSAMLIAALPSGVFIAFSRAFSLEARRLLRSGCAVAGWYGTRALGGEVGLAIEDQDLFPPANVTLNGMKIISGLPTSYVVGYANAVVQTAGSGLVPLFADMMKDQNGKHFHVDAFRRYEGGGLGAEIGGDVVLMGGYGFMRLMKVQMPEGTKLKQAVYLSVNGELAAVFALTYAPVSNVKSSLFAAVRSKGLLPILATRDFMITPQFLKQRYKFPPDRVEFPTVEERARLSDHEPRPEVRQGALLARSSFSSFVSAVTGARALRSAAEAAMTVSFVGGILGLFTLFFLTFIGAVQAVNCWNLMIFLLLWLLPNVLISTFSGGS